MEFDRQPAPHLPYGYRGIFADSTKQFSNPRIDVENLLNPFQKVTVVLLRCGTTAVAGTQACGEDTVSGPCKGQTGMIWAQG